MRLGAPNVENVAVHMPFIDESDVIHDENGAAIYFTDNGRAAGVGIGGQLPEDADVIGRKSGMLVD